MTNSDTVEVHTVHMKQDISALEADAAQLVLSSTLLKLEILSSLDAPLQRSISSSVRSDACQQTCSGECYFDDVS